MQLGERADGQREPGLEVLEDLVGQAQAVIHRRWPVRDDSYIESGQALHQISVMGRRQEMHAIIQPLRPHEGTERRF